MPEFAKQKMSFQIFLDVDECSLSLHNCHKNSNCTNINGLFLCICDTGYTGNGTVCEGKRIGQCGLSAIKTKNACASTRLKFCAFKKFFKLFIYARMFYVSLKQLYIIMTISSWKRKALIVFYCGKNWKCSRLTICLEKDATEKINAVIAWTC